MKDKHFFDSNIFLYAFSNKDMEKQIIVISQRHMSMLK